MLGLVAGMTRGELLEAIDSEWRALEEIVGGLAPEQFELPVLDDEAPECWRVRDLLVHLAAWKRHAATIAARRADLDDYPTQVLALDWDDFNRRLFEDWHDRPLAAVLAEHAGAHADLLAALDRLPLELLVAEERPRRWLAPALSHTRNHRERNLRPALVRPETAR